jgi:hypothetical protein
MKEQDLINALLRSDFNSFLYRCMLTLNPGAAFMPNCARAFKGHAPNYPVRDNYLR